MEILTRTSCCVNGMFIVRGETKFITHRNDVISRVKGETVGAVIAGEEVDRMLY